MNTEACYCADCGEQVDSSDYYEELEICTDCFKDFYCPEEE